MHGGLTVAKQCASLTLGHDSMVPAFFFHNHGDGLPSCRWFRGTAVVGWLLISSMH